MNEQPMHTQRERLVEELRAVAREAWRAWKSSSGSQWTVKIDTRTPPGEVKHRPIMREARGDVRFLHAVIRSVERQATLLGLADFVRDNPAAAGAVNAETARAVLDELLHHPEFLEFQDVSDNDNSDGVQRK